MVRENKVGVGDEMSWRGSDLKMAVADGMEDENGVLEVAREEGFGCW